MSEVLPRLELCATACSRNANPLSALKSGLTFKTAKTGHRLFAEFAAENGTRFPRMSLHA